MLERPDLTLPHSSPGPQVECAGRKRPGNTAPMPGRRTRANVLVVHLPRREGETQRQPAPHSAIGCSSVPNPPRDRPSAWPVSSPPRLSTHRPRRARRGRWCCRRRTATSRSGRGDRPRPGGGGGCGPTSRPVPAAETARIRSDRAGSAPAGRARGHRSRPDTGRRGWRDSNRSVKPPAKMSPMRLRPCRRPGVARSLLGPLRQHADPGRRP
jgi:hypothetical protein